MTLVLICTALGQTSPLAWQYLRPQWATQSLVKAGGDVGGRLWQTLYLQLERFVAPLPNTTKRRTPLWPSKRPWPKTLFSKDEQQNPVTDSVTGEVLCGSRAFHSQAEVDAAGGNAVWQETPQQAAKPHSASRSGNQTARPAAADHGAPAAAAAARA